MLYKLGTCYMAAALGSGFTWEQWKELERQAMIYNYMASSLSVPPHLLSSTSHSPFIGGIEAAASSSIFNLRFPKDKQDPEPGRCKRTDGKKWRCSRDVAPNHKYCERHMNRGRPRSRKPVEQQTNINPPFNLPNPSPYHNNNNNTHSFLLYHSSKTTNPHLSTAQPTRDLDWMMEISDMLTTDSREQQWQHLMQSSTSSGFQPSYGEEQQNSVCYANFSNSNDAQHNNFLMNSNLPPTDAWSNDIDNESSHGNDLSPSLELSMAIDEEIGNEPKPSGWWVGSTGTGGGPLGEVLLPSRSKYYF